MHFTVARARGIDLLGNYPVQTLPIIPREDYLSAILTDFEWASHQMEDQSQYTLANACRTLAYLHTGAILSKTEGRQWCRDNAMDTSNAVAQAKTQLRIELGS